MKKKKTEQNVMKEITNEIDRNRQIIEDAKKHKKEAISFDDRTSSYCYVYDVKITAKREVAIGRQGKEDEVFSIQRENIDIFGLKRLIENIERIADKVDLDKWVEQEIQEENEDEPQLL